MKKPPLIGPEIVLTPKEVAAGYTVVDVPLTDLDRLRLENSMSRTEADVGFVVRDSLRIEDIVSEEVVLQGNELLLHVSDTQEIRKIDFWPKKRLA